MLHLVQKPTGNLDALSISCPNTLKRKAAQDDDKNFFWEFWGNRTRNPFPCLDLERGLLLLPLSSVKSLPIRGYGLNMGKQYLNLCKIHKIFSTWNQLGYQASARSHGRAHSTPCRQRALPMVFQSLSLCVRLAYY